MYQEHYLTTTSGEILHLEAISGEVKDQHGTLFNGLRSIFCYKDGHVVKTTNPTPSELKRGWVFERIVPQPSRHR